MNIKYPISILFLITMLYACNSGSAPEESSDKAVAMTLSEPELQKGYKELSAPAANSEDVSGSEQTIANGNLPVTTKKKIIKDGTISVKTEDIAFSKRNMDATVKTLGAYYEMEDLQNNDHRTSYELKIRIPSENFEKLITAIETGKDEIVSKNIQARDVTEEYVDIETRLTNKRAYLKRYQELLSKARNVKEILEIEENIRAIEEEIESREGRLKYLNDQISFSTLNISLFKDKAFVYKPAPKDKFTERVKKALGNGWSSAVDFVIWIINGWAVWSILFIGIFFIRKLIRKRTSGKS